MQAKEVTIPVNVKWNFDINKLNFGVVLEHSQAKLPVKNQGDAGIDIGVVSDEDFFTETYKDIKGYELQPGERRLFSTGIKLQIPNGWFIMLKDRSGNANKYGLSVMAGIVDSGFRGTVKVVLKNTSELPVLILEGDRIAQMIILPDYDCVFNEIKLEDLTKTTRNDSGFGSSGR